MKFLCTLLGHRNEPWSEPYQGKEILWDHGQKVHEKPAILHCRICKRCGYAEVRFSNDFGGY
jgi:hypothetical protein